MVLLKKTPLGGPIDLRFIPLCFVSTLTSPTTSNIGLKMFGDDKGGGPNPVWIGMTLSCIWGWLLRAVCVKLNITLQNAISP
jgi:hypothetical protein